ncbi:MAG TPA: class I SAM-dependent methyltransferase [Steroidobacteraceae bacterium]|jgi:SAM-dependent methyltransferase
MKSNTEWELWGKADPLYGVASWAGRERGGSNPWTDAEFYALGEDWLDFEASWRRTVGFRAGTVVEIGSGAGRITRLLARSFEQVIATDVSGDILDYARARVALSNISWRKSDGDHIPAEDGSVDAAFSCHVFQHFPNNAAQLATFAEIARILKPDGTFLIHLPVHAFPEVNRGYSRLAGIGYTAFLGLSGARAAMRRLMIRVGLQKPYMHGVSYEVNELFAGLASLGFTDVSLSGITLRKSQGIHFCVSGRKAAARTTPSG